MISNQGSISTQARAIAGLIKGNLAFYWTFKLRNLNHQNLEQPPFALFFSMLSAPWRKRRKPARRSTLATCGLAIPSGPAVPHSPTSQTRSRADKRRLLPLRRPCVVGQPFTLLQVAFLGVILMQSGTEKASVQHWQQREGRGLMRCRESVGRRSKRVGSEIRVAAERT